MPPPSREIVGRLLGMELEPTTVSYDERDVALYALGIGAPADPLDPDELKFVYEGSEVGFRVFPTFAVFFDKDLLTDLLSGAFAGLSYQPMMMLHGEQEMEFFRALPARGVVTISQRVTNVYDKVSGMLIEIESRSFADSGDALTWSRYGIFFRGLGGFGGDRGPSVAYAMPERQPDFVHEEKTMDTQALLYRLYNDTNPLHADPKQAALGNFERPILHGLCTFGFAARALLKRCCGNDVGRLATFSARFSRHVFPGETLRTEIWRLDKGQTLFRTLVREREVVVLSRGRANVRD